MNTIAVEWLVEFVRNFQLEFLRSAGPCIDHGHRDLRNYSEGNNSREYSSTDNWGTGLDEWQNKWTTCLDVSDWTSIRQKLDLENMSDCEAQQLMIMNLS